MKRFLIVFLALLMALTAVSCSLLKKEDAKDDDKDKTEETEKSKKKKKDKETETETEKETEADLEFEFTFKSLKLKVNAVEEYEYDAESDSFEAPEGKYVVVNVNILEGEEATGELSGLYDCLKMNGYEPVNIGTSGIMNMNGGKMFVGTETVLSFRFDVPEDFDIARPVFTAED